jgi:hypothetical protein
MINIDDKFLKQTPLAEGGEGIIYEYNDSIIKIYKSNVDKNEKLKKIQLLMSKQLPSNVISPIDIVYNKNQFVGFMMNKVEGEEFKRLSNKKFIQINNIKTKDILKMLVDIKNILVTLHSQNIFISDLNDCNILFDKNFNVYFIDCDSWTIDNVQCTVCMDSFKDPLLKGNNFSSETDSFAWATLMFKSLTKIHPFGGTMNPDMDILERMKNRISVIENPSVTIPKTINKWTFISPKLLKELKETFETNKRVLINQTLDDYYSNLKYCDIDNEYYYSKFNECPICNSTAKVIDKPVKVATTANGIPMLLYFTNEFIKTILSLELYIDNDNYATHIKTGKKVKCKNNYKYYFSDDGEIIYAVSNKAIQIKTKSNLYTFDKINKSNVQVLDKKVYYVNLNNNLVELNITDSGNCNKSISKVSFNNLFEIIDDKNYFICNNYDNMKIINISGYNYTYMNTSKIVDYGIHFDTVTKRWLFIFEDSKGKFTTMVFDKNNLIYQSDSIKYTNTLSNLCFNNNVIFKPCDGAIKGYSYEKNIYKDFECSVVNEDSKIVKNSNKFIVINEKEIYKIG